MPHSVFKKGNKVETVESMIDYITFMQKIAQDENIPGAVTKLAQTLEELAAEKERRLDRQTQSVKISA